MHQLIWLLVTLLVSGACLLGWALCLIAHTEGVPTPFADYRRKYPETLTAQELANFNAVRWD